MPYFTWINITSVSQGLKGSLGILVHSCNVLGRHKVLFKKGRIGRRKLWDLLEVRKIPVVETVSEYHPNEPCTHTPHLPPVST